jgi:hypothetical protein
MSAIVLARGETLGLPGVGSAGVALADPRKDSDAQPAHDIPVGHVEVRLDTRTRIHTAHYLPLRNGGFGLESE